MSPWLATLWLLGGGGLILSLEKRGLHPDSSLGKLGVYGVVLLLAPLLLPVALLEALKPQVQKWLKAPDKVAMELLHWGRSQEPSWQVHATGEPFPIHIEAPDGAEFALFLDEARELHMAGFFPWKQEPHGREFALYREPRADAPLSLPIAGWRALQQQHSAPPKVALDEPFAQEYSYWGERPFLVPLVGARAYVRAHISRMYRFYLKHFSKTPHKAMGSLRWHDDILAMENSQAYFACEVLPQKRLTLEWWRDFLEGFHEHLEFLRHGEERWAEYICEELRCSQRAHSMDDGVSLALSLRPFQKACIASLAEGFAGTKAQKKGLHEALHGEDPHLQIVASRYHTSEPGAQASRIAQSSRYDNEARMAALELLCGLWNRPSLLPLLKKIILDARTTPELRALATTHWCSQHEASHIPELLDALPDAKPLLQIAMLKALTQIGEPAMGLEAQILPLLAIDYEALQIAAARALGILGTPQSIAALHDLKATRRVRKVARQSIEKLQQLLPQAKPGQLSLAQDPEASGQLSIPAGRSGELGILPHDEDPQPS